MTKALNKYCPNSGKSVQADSVTKYKGFIVGFCNQNCKDTFAKNSGKASKAKNYFDTLIKEQKIN